MSLQIRIAQSGEDEVALAEWLQARGDFWFHPRIFKAGTFHPRPFAAELGIGVQCFRVADEAVVRMHIAAIKPQWWKPQDIQQRRQRLEQIVPSNALSIEWSRTEWPMATTCIPGRLYFDNRTPASETILVDLAKIMRRLVAMIRRNYPQKSPDRYPCYVGPDVRRIESGEVRLLYAGGAKEIPLIENR